MIERGTIGVQQALALPFAPGQLPGWPAVAAHAVTRTAPGAAWIGASHNENSISSSPRPMHLLTSR